MVFGEKRYVDEKVNGERVRVQYRVFDIEGTVYLGVAAWVVFVAGLLLG